ncbi:MAG TPA: AtpZ/AtpI family protein [bacterium]|nr:AtpZ/AtpI family protein [bacterium]
MQDEEKKQQEKEEEEKIKQRQRIGVYTGIPMTLLSGVGMGYLMGAYLEKKFPSDNLILAGCLIFGFVAGFKLVLDYIKKFG